MVEYLRKTSKCRTGKTKTSSPLSPIRWQALLAGAFQADKRVRVYDTENGWRMVKDVHARNLRWTITDTCLSKDQRLLLYATINPIVHMVRPKMSSPQMTSCRLPKRLVRMEKHWHDHYLLGAV